MSKEVKAKEIVIKNVVVTIGDRDIILTVEEAKKLKVALEELFPSPIKETKIIRENYDWDKWYRDPYVWPYTRPTITWDSDRIGDIPMYEVTCGGASAKIDSNLKAYNTKSTMFLSING